MADGHLIFDTKIDEGGFNKGISKLSNIAQTGLGVVVGNICLLYTSPSPRDA